MNEKIPLKGTNFSKYIATFAPTIGFDTYLELQH